MSFVSIQFAIFLPVVVAAYFLIPIAFRWQFLLVASLYCYAAPVPIFLPVLLFLGLASYGLALLLDREPDGPRRRWILGLGLGVLFAPIALFKYAGFVNQELGRWLSIDGAPLIPGIELILPVGISFHTFQTAGYLIDVYRRARGAERHLGIYLLFVSFFPQLAAGPIERSTHLLVELRGFLDPDGRRALGFDAERVTSGLRLVLWGAFKKLVIADNLAPIVNEVYAAPSVYGGVALLLATYAFAYQIYCDFSGYTDIARGIGRVLGIELLVNFDRPYQATSIREFWQRWHISLTSWFRDYVYIPLGGNRVSSLRWLANVSAVFVLSGIWHGANWTFIVWGAIHAAAFAVAELPALLRGGPARAQSTPVLPVALRWLLTFHVVVLAWVFFRAPSVGIAWTVLEAIARDVPPALAQLAASLVQSGLPAAAELPALLGMKPEHAPLFFNGGMMIVLAAIASVELIDHLSARERAGPSETRFPAYVRWAGYYAAALLIWIAAPLGSTQFIYFAF